MSKINVCSFLCKECDKEEQSIKNIVNEIRVSEEKKETISIATIINGIRPENENFYLDYFIQFLCDERLSNETPPQYVHLFSVDMMPKESTECKEDLPRTVYKGAFFDTLYDSFSIHFPGKGFYELRVYLCETPLEGKAIERYKKYQKDDIEPISIYAFKVC